MKTPKEFEQELRKMFDSIWNCEIDNIFWDDTVGDLMRAVIQSYKNDYKKPIEQQPCDAISRADAIRIASGYCHPVNIPKELAKLPPVQPKPRVGHWIYDKRIENWKCSECGCSPKTIGYVGRVEFMREHFKFCNHCGARMIETQESVDKE